MERVTIKAIHSAEEHRSALDVIERIMDLDVPDESDLAMLETLAILVERYEDRQFPLQYPTALDAVRYRMDQMGLTQADLARLTGYPRSRVSDLLGGKRPPSLDMVRALHATLGIPAEILIGKAPVPTAS